MERSLLTRTHWVQDIKTLCSLLSVDFDTKCSVSGLRQKVFYQWTLSQHVLSVHFVITCSVSGLCYNMFFSGLCYTVFCQWTLTQCQWTLTQNVLSVDFDFSSHIKCHSCPIKCQTAPSEMVSLCVSKETYPFMDVLLVNFMSDDM